MGNCKSSSSNANLKSKSSSNVSPESSIAEASTLDRTTDRSFNIRNLLADARSWWEDTATFVDSMLPSVLPRRLQLIDLGGNGEDGNQS